jgi:hypothetical protein
MPEGEPNDPDNDQDEDEEDAPPQPQDLLRMRKESLPGE